MNKNRYMEGAAISLILAGFILTGCHGLPGPGLYAPDISSEAFNRLEELKKMDRDQALAGLEELVVEYPSFVEAHRRIQILNIEDNRYGYLMNRYLNAYENNPDDPAACYLYGRLLTSSEDQVEMFSKSVARDHSFFWGYNGLGFASRDLGRIKSSISAFQCAMASAPERIEPYKGLISLYLANKNHKEAKIILEQGKKQFPNDVSLFLLECRLKSAEHKTPLMMNDLLNTPDEMELSREYFLTLIRALEKTSNDEVNRKVLNKFRVLGEQDHDYGEILDLLLGICSRKQGQLSGALCYFSRVFSATPANLRARRELRYLYAVTGDLEKAMTLQTLNCPGEWTQNSCYNEKNRKRILEIADLLNTRGAWNRAGDKVFELASLLKGMGWLDEATYYLFPLSNQTSPLGLRARELLEKINGHNRLEQEIKDFFLKQYKHFLKTGAYMDKDDVMKKLGEISNSAIHKNIFKDCTFLDFSPAGLLLDIRSKTKCGPSEYFRKYNRFFLMGKKSGGPMEAYLLDLYDVSPDMRMEVAGESIEFDLIRCENLRIPSLIEFGGGNIAGAGLHSILFLNIDSMRQKLQAAHHNYKNFRKKEVCLLQDPAPLDESPKDCLNHLGLPARLRYLSYKNHGARGGDGDYMRVLYNAILTHEVLHLADARKFLPITSNLLWTVIKFFGKGFSRFNIEAWLEERAQLYSLYVSHDTHGVLAEMADFIQGPTYRSPHQKGYRDLMDRIVEHLYDNQGEFPQIKFNCNILHQLHKLSANEIRRIAGKLSEEEDFIEN